MLKLLFAPVSVISGLVAGLAGKKLFTRVWGLIDDAEPPRPEQRGVTWGKLVGALLIEGAVFRLVKGAVEHSTRQGFARFTGRWPGEQAPPRGSEAAEQGRPSN
jgi:uncharacterized protein DUF4235